MKGDSKLAPTASEIEMRKIAHRSITVLKDMCIGETFSPDNLGMRRPGTGLPASLWDSILGKKARRNLIAGTQLCMEDVNND